MHFLWKMLCSKWLLSIHFYSAQFVKKKFSLAQSKFAASTVALKPDVSGFQTFTVQWMTKIGTS